MKPRRVGCWIEATSSGALRIRFRWHLPAATGLHKFSENTTLRDTPENRVTLTKQAAMGGAEIAANHFDYLRWFPNGSRAPFFQRVSRATDSAVPETPATVGQ